MRLKKTLGKIDSLDVEALMRLIESQNKETIANFSLNWVKDNIYPIYNKLKPSDKFVANTLDVATKMVNKQISVKEAKIEFKQLQELAREMTYDPVLEAALRTIHSACSSYYTPTYALSVAFYGSATLAYYNLGLTKSSSEYETYADQVISNLYQFYLKHSIKDEPNPVKINWYC